MHPRTLLSPLVAILLSLSGISVGQAAVVHSTTPDQAYIDYGNNVFPYMGFIEGTKSNGDIQFQSAVFLNRNFAIASAHAFYENSLFGNPLLSDIQLGSGPNSFTDRGEVQSITAFDLHPSFAGGGNGYDLALLYSEQGFSSVNQGATLFSGDPFALNPIFTDIHHAGYGRTGTNLTGPIARDGNVRAGTNALTSVGNAGTTTDNFISSIFHDRNRRVVGRELGIGLAAGDSGGGTFIEIGGEMQLIGINSIIGAGIYSSGQSASLIDITWVDQTMRSRTTAIPEPCALPLILTAFGFLSLRRCRRHGDRNSANLECVDRNGIKSLA